MKVNVWVEINFNRQLCFIVVMEYKQWHCKNQNYEGTFLGDSFHGNGTYKWDNSNVYEGSFYSNSKEGYALLSLPNNSNFEGLFIKNYPFGPGILTYSNGRQDVGFWLGEKLVRLSRPVDYIIPRLAPTLTAKLKLLRFRRLITLDEPNQKSTTDILKKYHYQPRYFRSPFSRLIYDTNSLFFDVSFFDSYLLKPMTAVNFKSSQSDVNSATITDQCAACEERKSDSCFLQHNSNENFLISNQEYDKNDICFSKESLLSTQTGILKYYTKFGNFDGFKINIFDEAITDFSNDEGIIVKIEGPKTINKEAPKIFSWNRGELCAEIVKQIYKHRAFEDKLNFKITELMSGMRTAFRKTGEKERKCLYFLKMCFLGPSHIVKELLCDSEISESLMDSRGNNGLIFAAAGDQIEIIDILSDYGVDVNAFNDENLTPLNLCLLRRLALDNDIWNWETAFLSPEENKDFDENLHESDLNRFISNQSLDRLFGDGMSILNDKIRATPLNSEKASAVTIPPTKELSARHVNSLPQKSSSQITILQFKTSMKSSDRIADRSETSLNNASLLPGFQSQTINAKHKSIPKSHRREEYERSVGYSPDDKYLFDLHINEILPPVTPKNQKRTEKIDKSKKVATNIEVITRQEVNIEIQKKLNVIDQTIDQLLKRGADPNIPDVPKPAIHLGIFTQNSFIVDRLLFYGADPNHRLNIEEGYLTPLHVLVLLKPRFDYLKICQILLDFGADPECETDSNFSMRKEENDFLNPHHGRTPLQLLCMRPDIEHGDPLGQAISLGLLLAKVTNKNHFFNGHSGLTLAMLYGNIRLVEAFLKAGCFDPNQDLENLGTPLHILVSAFFQKKTIYEDSIKMIDLLLAAGADPLLSIAIGNCIEYGYQEVEVEKASRKTGQKGKTTAKPEKGEFRDYLKDQIKVLEYLLKKQQEKQNYNITGFSSKVSKSTKTEGLPSSVLSEGLSEKGRMQFKRVQMKENLNSIIDLKNPTLPITVANESDTMESNKARPDDFADNKTQKTESQYNTKKRKKADQKSNGDYKGHQKTKKEDENFKEPAQSHVSADKNERAPETGIIESFSGFVLKSLLKLFGDCTNIDLNQFTLPYVVLRDGNFYYKFHGVKAAKKEQYSLV